MNAGAIVPDVAPQVTPAHSPQHAPARIPGADSFAKMVDALGGTFARAQTAEDAFARGKGDLLHAVYDRAQADVALSVAAAAAQRAAQALQTILSMQI